MQTCRPLLNVADIEGSLTFWRDGVGFEVVTRYPSEGRSPSPICVPAMSISC